MTTPDLLAAWRDLVARAPALSARDLDREAEQLYGATRRAMAGDPAVREHIVSAFTATGEESGGEALNRWLAGAVLPPGLRALDNPDGFRAHPEVALDGEALPVAPALALGADHALASDAGFRADPLLWTGSWVGGTPAVPRDRAGTWAPPTGPGGVPLAFVVQVDLTMEAANQGHDRWLATGLPDVGVLQVFHDLHSDGWGEESVGACAVRWVEDVEVDQLVLADPAAAGALVPLNPQLVPTCPAPDTSSDGAADERHARARDWLDLVAVRANETDDARPVLTPWHPGYARVAPVSRLRGYGAAPAAAVLRACLDHRLPVTPGDRHVLLLDLNPASPEARGLATTLNGRHLEVWMRASDLAAARFDETWAVLRD